MMGWSTTRQLKTWTVACSVVALVIASPAAAYADATAFLGVNTTPSNRTTKGFAIGVTVLVVGVEFEYSDTSEDLEAAAPSLRVGSGNLLVQTPFPIGGLQFYGTAGAGVYRERLATIQETNFAANIGGGVKMTLAGPLKLRLDYRLFTLKGSPLHDNQQRIYAGLNLMF
jgi:opacity protein-like surface antigen